MTTTIHKDYNARRMDYAKVKPEEALVHSMFYTLQGEGPFAGCPAVFVRLAGCNLGSKDMCPWCDTAFEFKDGKVMRVADILEGACKLVPPEVSRLMVLTGGEPLLQNPHLLIRHFINFGWQVQIETNGYFWTDQMHGLRLDFSDQQLCIVVSPKVNARKVYPELDPRLWRDMNVLKVLLDDDPTSPYFKPPEYAYRFTQLRDNRPVYVSPVNHYKQAPEGVASFWNGALDHELCRRNHRYAASFAKTLGWRLSLQTHLFAEVE